MRVADFVRISCGAMKMLSKFGIRMDDFKYVDLFLDYEAMNGNGGYNALIKQKLMESIWGKMDDKEHIAFAIASLQNSNHQETMSALNGLSQKIDQNKHSWLSGFGANVAGNAAFGGAALILSKILKL